MAEEESNDIDVQALLASINANFDNEQLLNQVEHEAQVIHQVQDELQSNLIDQKSESIVIVNEKPAIQKEVEDIDPIIEILNRVDIQNSLLTNAEINKHQLETAPLQQIVHQIKDKFDNQQEQIFRKQKHIFDQIIEIKTLSTQLVNGQSHGLSKMKLNDFKNKQKEIEQLDIQMFKTKGYVLSVIERLENIEQFLDKKIDVYVKQKVKLLSQHQ